MNRFTIYDDEVKSALKLIKKLGNTTNEVIDTLNEKTDKTGNHLGAWQGLDRPTLSEEGMRATVENLNEKVIPEMQTKINGGALHVQNVEQLKNALEDINTSNIYLSENNYIIDDVINVKNKNIKIEAHPNSKISGEGTINFSSDLSTSIAKTS